VNRGEEEPRDAMNALLNRKTRPSVDLFRSGDADATRREGRRGQRARTRKTRARASREAREEVARWGLERAWCSRGDAVRVWPRGVNVGRERMTAKRPTRAQRRGGDVVVFARSRLKSESRVIGGALTARVRRGRSEDEEKLAAAACLGHARRARTADRARRGSPATREARTGDGVERASAEECRLIRASARRRRWRTRRRTRRCSRRKVRGSTSSTASRARSRARPARRDVASRAGGVIPRAHSRALTLFARSESRLTSFSLPPPPRPALLFLASQRENGSSSTRRDTGRPGSSGTPSRRRKRCPRRFVAPADPPPRSIADRNRRPPTAARAKNECEIEIAPRGRPI